MSLAGCVGRCEQKKDVRQGHETLRGSEKDLIEGAEIKAGYCPIKIIRGE